jgi:hypothetical protein
VPGTGLEPAQPMAKKIIKVKLIGEGFLINREI